MDNEEIYQEAEKKVKAKKGFFFHFLAYGFTLAMLYYIMQYENNGEILPVIIVGLSWGIGIAAHYFTAFGTENLELLGISPNWEEEELEQEIAKLRRIRELKGQLQEEKDLLEESERLELREIVKKPKEDDFL